MKKYEQYQNLLLLKQEINKKLEKQDFAGRKELILWLTKSKEYQKLKNSDNQLFYLECASKIWICEKKKLTEMGILEDIFTGVISLETLERKYLTMQFAGLRLEQNVPEEYQLQAVDMVIEKKISGIAAFVILQRETLSRIENTVKLSVLFKERGYRKQAVVLLLEALETYRENTELRLELADCYLTGGEIAQAYLCLQEIKNPSEDIRLLITDLEGVLKNERE